MLESKCFQNWKFEWNELFHLEYKIRNDLLFIVDGTKSNPSAQVM
jgi:hypothetical protein